ncbi:hypothetical protein [Cryptosporangium sp. NPDC051539]|uniref:hypothetical protein n=1 Tax=Cryptosporangium sp. NPDC051539 TaxID=3363962 RepID=UPI003789FD8E
MKRVVVLGRGGAGKSTLARALGEKPGVPVHRPPLPRPSLTGARPGRRAAVRATAAGSPALVASGRYAVTPSRNRGATGRPRQRVFQ